MDMCMIYLVVRLVGKQAVLGSLALMLFKEMDQKRSQQPLGINKESKDFCTCMLFLWQLYFLLKFSFIVVLPVDFYKCIDCKYRKYGIGSKSVLMVKYLLVI